MQNKREECYHEFLRDCLFTKYIEDLLWYEELIPVPAQSDSYQDPVEMLKIVENMGTRYQRQSRCDYFGEEYI